jgi:hypothetical protein
MRQPGEILISLLMLHNDREGGVGEWSMQAAEQMCTKIKFPCPGPYPPAICFDSAFLSVAKAYESQLNSTK